MKIDGRVAIVTGASSGIGEATACELAKRGAKVVAMARRADKLEAGVERCRAYDPDAVANPGDVSSRKDCERVVNQTEERHGRVDILVNNAGIALRKRADQTSVEEIERLFSINFFGAVYMTMAGLRGMVERRQGAIINVTSVAGYLPNPLEGAYGASKAALSMWTHGLNVDLHGTGVHAGVLSPGPIDTEIWTGDDDYRGKLYPPSVVAEAAARMIERQITHMTSPRVFGAVGAVYPLAGRPMRWGLRQFAERMERRAPEKRGGRNA